MNIRYVDHLGDKNISDVLATTEKHVFYRTLSFDFAIFAGNEFDCFTRFLDEKIHLTEILVSGNTVVMIRHNTDADIEYKLIEHAITLLSARILTCSSVHWTLIPEAGLDGFRVEIILPVTNLRQSTDNLINRLKENEKPNFKRREIKSKLWSRVLMLLGLRKRKGKIIEYGYAKPAK